MYKVFRNIVDGTLTNTRARKNHNSSFIPLVARYNPPVVFWAWHETRMNRMTKQGKSSWDPVVGGTHFQISLPECKSVRNMTASMFLRFHWLKMDHCQPWINHKNFTENASID